MIVVASSKPMGKVLFSKALGDGEFFVTQRDTSYHKPEFGPNREDQYAMFYKDKHGSVWSLGSHPSINGMEKVSLEQVNKWLKYASKITSGVSPIEKLRSELMQYKKSRGEDTSHIKSMPPNKVAEVYQDEFMLSDKEMDRLLRGLPSQTESGR